MWIESNIACWSQWSEQQGDSLSPPSLHTHSRQHAAKGNHILRPTYVQTDSDTPSNRHIHPS